MHLVESDVGVVVDSCLLKNEACRALCFVVAAVCLMMILTQRVKCLPYISETEHDPKM